MVKGAGQRTGILEGPEHRPLSLRSGNALPSPSAPLLSRVSQVAFSMAGNRLSLIQPLSLQKAKLFCFYSLAQCFLVTRPSSWAPSVLVDKECFSRHSGNGTHHSESSQVLRAHVRLRKAKVFMKGEGLGNANVQFSSFHGVAMENF